jgi:peptidoglycan hydrolase-like protein with peptidoglycan-binding domain
MLIEDRRRPRRAAVQALSGFVALALVLMLTMAPVSSAVTTRSLRAKISGTANVLSIGSSGPSVAGLQRRLTVLGYRPGAVDGNFGSSTASAVLAFQKREGLPRTGIVGLMVQSALSRPSGAGPRPGLPIPRIEVDIARQIAFVVLPIGPS